MVRTSSVPNRKWGFVVLALFSTFVVAFLASLATYVFYRTKSSVIILTTRDAEGVALDIKKNLTLRRQNNHADFVLQEFLWATPESETSYLWSPESETSYLRSPELETPDPRSPDLRSPDATADNLTQSPMTFGFDVEPVFLQQLKLVSGLEDFALVAGRKTHDKKEQKQTNEQQQKHRKRHQEEQQQQSCDCDAIYVTEIQGNFYIKLKKNLLRNFTQPTIEICTVLQPAPDAVQMQSNCSKMFVSLVVRPMETWKICLWIFGTLGAGLGILWGQLMHWGEVISTGQN